MLTVADLLSTLAVEAAVHHLDLVVRLDRPGPAAGPLAEVRRVLEGLLGGPLPDRWDDATAARRGTGREPLTDDDRAELGRRARRRSPCSADRLRPTWDTGRSCPPPPSPTATDVLVVGAGPAGSAAAAWAARAGHDVVLADAAVFPRDKTCGDGLTPRAIAELDLLGLGDWVRGHARNRGLRAAGFGQEWQLPWPGGAFPDHGSAVPRTELDARIREVALDSRRHRRSTGARAVDVERDGDRVTGVVFELADDEPCHASPAGGWSSPTASRSPLGRVLGREWHRDTAYGVAARGYVRSGPQRRRVDLLAPRAARRPRASCCPATAGCSRSARPRARSTSASARWPPPAVRPGCS